MKYRNALLRHLAVWYVISASELSALSPLRPEWHQTPMLITYYEPTDPQKSPVKKYRRVSPYLESWAHFTRMDHASLLEHSLPTGPIPDRYNPQETITTGTYLSQRIEDAIQSILHAQKRSALTGITILKDRDWNYQNKSGLIIFKLSDLPFVVKFYRETPETYVSPMNKGLEPALFNVMSGGINRYQLGFTRLKNGDAVRRMIEASDEWRDRVTLPREWYYQPRDTKFFVIEGHNMGCDKPYTIKVPTMYAIVADWIDGERSFAMSNPNDRLIAMDLSRYLRNRIDPNIKNFIIERKTKKIAIIDTEHFASVVGLKQHIEFRNYWNWYSRLAGEFLKRGFATTMPTRRRLCNEPLPESLIV